MRINQGLSLLIPGVITLVLNTLFLEDKITLGIMGWTLFFAGLFNLNQGYWGEENGKKREKS